MLVQRRACGQVASGTVAADPGIRDDGSPVDRDIRPVDDDSAEAIFFADGNAFVPTPVARGPWGEFIGGQNVGGLLGRAIERDAGQVDMQFARLTIDLPRRVALEPVVVATTVQREGKRIRLVDAVLSQGGEAVARARAVFLRRSAHPENHVWSSPVTMPAIPVDDKRPPNGFPMQAFAYNASQPHRPNNDITVFEQPCQKFMWLRVTTPLVHGEQMTPFTRAAMAADATSTLTNFGPKGLHFINADYTLTLSRLPEGEFVGLAALTHYGHDGVATGVATVFDQRGPIGSSMAIGIANGGFGQLNTPAVADASRV